MKVNPVKFTLFRREDDVIMSQEDGGRRGIYMPLHASERRTDAHEKLASRIFGSVEMHPLKARMEILTTRQPKLQIPPMTRFAIDFNPCANTIARWTRSGHDGILSCLLEHELEGATFQDRSFREGRRGADMDDGLCLLNCLGRKEV